MQTEECELGWSGSANELAAETPKLEHGNASVVGEICLPAQQWWEWVDTGSGGDGNVDGGGATVGSGVD